MRFRLLILGVGLSLLGLAMLIGGNSVSLLGELAEVVPGGQFGAGIIFLVLGSLALSFRKRLPAE